MLYVSHISIKCEGEGEGGNTPLPTLVYVNAWRGRGQWTDTQCPAETHYQSALKCTVPRWGCFATTGFFPCGLSFCHCLMVLGPFKPICCYSVAQLCPTLCNPMDTSQPGSSIHGISQTRTLEWVAISRDLPNLGTEPWSPTLQADSLASEPPGKPYATDLLGLMTGFFVRRLFCALQDVWLPPWLLPARHQWHPFL